MASHLSHHNQSFDVPCRLNLGGGSPRLLHYLPARERGIEIESEYLPPIPPEMQAEADESRNRSALCETLFQDDSGKIEEPVGQTCSRLLCFQIEDAEDHSLRPGRFWLSVVEGEHYRFFVDTGAYIVQWFRADPALLEQEISEDPDCILDLSLLYGLQGSKIVSVTVERVWQDSLYILCLTLLLSEGHSLRLEYAGDRTSMVVT